MSPHNRFGALELLNEVEKYEENESNKEEDQGPPRPGHSRPGIKTSSKKNPRRVIVVGDSILRGIEGPICRPDPLHREVCCLPGAHVKDLTAKVPALVRPKDYYPLLVFQVSSDDITRKSPKAMKRDFRSLGKVIRGLGAQIVFSSIPSGGGMEEKEYRRTQQMNLWLQDWCYRQGFGFFNHGLVYRAPDLLALDGMHLSQRGKRILGQELAGLIDRALN